MNTKIARSIDDRELAMHGIRRVGDRPGLRSRVRSSGGVLLLGISGATSELTIDTATVYPEHSVFAFVETQALWSRLEGEPWVETEGGLVIAPQGITRRLRWAGSWRVSAALVPRSAIASFVPSLAPDANVYPERRLLDTSMQQFVTGLLDADAQASAIEQYAIEQLVMEMSGAMLLDRMGAVTGQGTPHEVLRERAIAVIAQQCGDPALNPARVAREVQSSLRQLQLVFSESGNSVAGEIRRQRARLAHSLLMDSRYDVLSIDQIAQRAGFHSPMSLRRALDDAYSCTPRALRAARRA
ncbi:MULTISPECIES: helix-turn-helix domain-containing protein [unclassified Microbacterium]|uniref:helix-turn-helix domain-containing protein n=1 Tax=unclassified Microbacterium TaxID=2609290 RepID=UPI0016053D39|nr:MULTISPECIES: helix-turn-helix domain-containing protein [unclassified Microbacterium]QNA91999.1 helix-turn-helix domain-containing protein [Microbacterium sp. Se63.02b]QYM65230.1 helix-turn-helix domain-containing protein [Microbacterium sp. Se5.02b]